jgi:ferric-dicitrate binding protein FerR (iron transport regulator)
MNLDNAIKAWKIGIDEARWDAVTERRVLTRLLSQRRKSRNAVSRPRLVAAAAIAAAVLAILGLFIFTFDNGAHPTVPEDAKLDIAGLGAKQGPRTGLSQLRFLDGSTATYLTTAEVDVEEQSISAVKIWHKSGQVRYQVKKAPAREFVVNAGGIEVRVVGTVFIVEVDITDVKVKVERGVVIVDSGSGVVEPPGSTTKAYHPSPI